MKFQTLSEYFRQNTLICLNYLANKKITLFERFLWFFVTVCMLIITGFIIHSLQHQLFANPTVTSLERRDYPVENIDFPGVAICNINVISKKRANMIADKLVNITNKPKKDVLKYIDMLGNFLHLNIRQSSEFLIAQQVLDQYYDESLRMFTPFLMLRELQLPCDELMKECYWLNKEYKCNELFQIRITFTGFCCTFNYVRELDKIIASMNVTLLRKKQFKVEEIGLDNGIKVVINNDFDDYFHSASSLIGVKILTFNSEDYPDMSSGGLSETFTSTGVEALLSVHPRTIYSTAAIRAYPMDVRKCCFDDEIETIYGKYSHSNCLVQCKVYSMIALCGCVPYHTPLPANYPICKLQDIVCLNKYMVKWNTPFPVDSENVEELAHEREDSLVCEKCYVSCSDTVYQIETSFTPLINANETVVRIYFQSNYAYLYKQDAQFYWFEILSIIGGLLGIMLGCSVMTIVEIIKFLSERVIIVILKQFYY